MAQTAADPAIDKALTFTAHLPQLNHHFLINILNCRNTKLTTHSKNIDRRYVLRNLGVFIRAPVREREWIWKLIYCSFSQSARVAVSCGDTWTLTSPLTLNCGDHSISYALNTKRCHYISNDVKLFPSAALER